MVSRPAASALSGSWLEMQTLGPHPEPTESKTLGVEPSNPLELHPAPCDYNASYSLRTTGLENCLQLSTFSFPIHKSSGPIQHIHTHAPTDLSTHFTSQVKYLWNTFQIALL